MIKWIIISIFNIFFLSSFADAKLEIDKEGDKFFGVDASGIVAPKGQLLPAYYYIYEGQDLSATIGDAEGTEYYDEDVVLSIVDVMRSVTSKESTVWGIFVVLVPGLLLWSGLETYGKVSAGRMMVGDASVSYLIKILLVFFMGSFVVGGIARFTLAMGDKLSGIEMPNKQNISARQYEIGKAEKLVTKAQYAPAQMVLLNSHAKLADRGTAAKQAVESISKEQMDTAWGGEGAKAEAIKIIEDWQKNLKGTYKGLNDVFTGSSTASTTANAMSKYTQTDSSAWLKLLINQREGDVDPEKMVSPVRVAEVVCAKIEDAYFCTLKNRLRLVTQGGAEIDMPDISNLSSGEQSNYIKSFNPYGNPALPGGMIKPGVIGEGATGVTTVDLTDTLGAIQKSTLDAAAAQRLPNAIKSAVMMGATHQGIAIWGLPIAFMIMTLMMALPDALGGGNKLGAMVKIVATCLITHVLITTFVIGAINCGVDAINAAKPDLSDGGVGAMLALDGGPGNLSTKFATKSGVSLKCQAFSTLITIAPLIAAGLVMGGNALGQHMMQKASQKASQHGMQTTLSKITSFIGGVNQSGGVGGMVTRGLGYTPGGYLAKKGASLFQSLRK